MSTKLNTWSVRLLISSTFLKWARVLVQIFLSIYVWKETNDIKIIALFNVWLHIFHMFWFFIGSFWVKAWYRNLVNYLAFSTLILLYIFISFFPQLIIDYIYFIWIFLWLGVWLYYVNYHLNQFDLSHFKNRWNLEWIKKSLKISVKIIFPIIFGFIISIYSMTWAFIFAIILLCFGMYYGRIDFQPSVWKVSLTAFIQVLKKNRRIGYSLLWSLFLTFSFSAILIDAILSVVLFERLWTDLKLWLSLSMVSAMSIIIVYIFGKFVKYKYYNAWLVVFTILYAISLLGFLYADSYTTILILSSCVLSVILLHQVMTWVLTSNSLQGVENIDDYKVEFYIFREMASITWWTIWFWLMYIAWDLSQQSLKFIFYTMMWFSIITTSLFMKVNIHELDN